MSFVPTAAAVLNQWVRILGALEKKINRQSFETWLKPTRFSRVVDKTLYVRIPSAQFEHIGDKYGELIEEAIEKLGLEIDEVVFETPRRIRRRRGCARTAALPRCRATPRNAPARSGSRGNAARDRQAGDGAGDASTGTRPRS